MKTLLHKALRVGALILVAWAVNQGALAEEKHYTGLGLDNLWGTDGNWAPNPGEPGAGDDAFHNIGGTVVMDVSGLPYHVGSLSAAAAGTLQIDEDRFINLMGNALNVAGVNAYRVEIPHATWFTVGSPFDMGGVGVADSEARDVEWSVTTGTLAVAGLIGRGRMTASGAVDRTGNILVGFTIDPEPKLITGVRGTIDSEVTGAVPSHSRWTLNGVSLRAKVCKNLDEWVIIDSNGVASDIQAHGFFEASKLSFAGLPASAFRALAASAAGDGGLVIKQSANLYRGTSNLIGPFIEVEKLIVNPNAVLTLSHGSRFHIRETTISGITHSFAPVLNEFRDGSSLRYGQRLQIDGCPPDCPANCTYACSGACTETCSFVNCCPPITLFDTHQVGGGESREPALKFLGQSYITSKNDPNKSVLQDMQLNQRVHLVIEAVTSQPPAIGWHTGGVDIEVHVDGQNEQRPARHEAIAADVCNVFFTDVSEPRCVKYWRSLKVDRPSDTNTFQLVDDYDNHQPNTLPPGGNHEDYPEAMYVRSDVTLVDGGGARILLGDHRLYYGGLLSDPEGGITPAANAIPLILTRYGDFNGDCQIDNTDYYNYLRPHITSSGVPSDYPLGDFDGDCDIDLRDIGAFRARTGGDCLCANDPLDCKSAPALNCPPWLGGGTGTGAGASSAQGVPSVPGAVGVMASIEQDAPFFAQAFVDYLKHETLPEAPSTENMDAAEGEAALAAYAETLATAQATFVATVQETAAWLAVNLNEEEQAQLAAQLSDPSIAFQIPTAVGLIPTLLAALSG